MAAKLSAPGLFRRLDVGAGGQIIPTPAGSGPRTGFAVEIELWEGHRRGPVVAILFSLTAIIVRSIAAPEMDGKISADAVHFKTLP